LEKEGTEVRLGASKNPRAVPAFSLAVGGICSLFQDSNQREGQLWVFTYCFLSFCPSAAPHNWFFFSFTIMCCARTDKKPRVSRFSVSYVRKRKRKNKETASWEPLVDWTGRFYILQEKKK